MPLVEPAASEADTTEADKGPLLAVKRFTYEGAGLFSATQLDAVTARFRGPDRTLGDLRAAANAITRFYADQGYPLAFALVPPQDIANGAVRLRVVEGRIDTLSIELGDGVVLAGRRSLERAIRARLEPLLAETPLSAATLERALLLAGDLAGVDLTSVIRPSPTTEGAAQLVVQAAIDPLAARVVVDNRLRSAFDRYRQASSLDAFSVALPGDRLTFDARSSLTSDAFLSGTLSYTAPISADGLTLAGSYARVRSRAKRGFLGLLDFDGREEVIRLAISQPIVRRRAQNLSLELEASAINADSGLLGLGLVQDRARGYALGLLYDWADRAGSRGLVRIGYNQGLAVLDATRADDPLRSRVNGDPRFAALTASVSLITPLPAGLAVRVEGEAQRGIHRSALAPRECTIGGDRLGRGYDYGAAGGEHCLAMGVELSGNARVAGIGLAPFVFADAARIEQAGGLEPGERRSVDLWSAGFGLGFLLPWGIEGKAYAAWPGNRAVLGGGPAGPRVFFSLGWRG